METPTPVGIILLDFPGDPSFTGSIYIRSRLELGCQQTPWTMISRGEMERILSKPLAFRTSRLWCQDNWGYWWKLVLRPEEYERSTLLYKEDTIEQCLPLLAPAVWEAGEKLKEYVIPVFEEVVRRHGSAQSK